MEYYLMKTIAIGLLLSFSAFSFQSNTCSDSTHKPELKVTYTTNNLIAAERYTSVAHVSAVKSVPSKTFQGVTIKYFPFSTYYPHSVLAVYTLVAANGKEVPQFAVYSNPPVNTVDILDKKLQGLVSAGANGKLVFSQKVTDQLAYEGLYVLRQCK
jgi:hypothetical protein